MIALLVTLVFVAVEGGVIFATAWICARFLGARSRLAKVGLMLASYVLWAGLTITGYGMLGGDGGLMDGFGLVLMLCFTALIGTFVYAVAWAIFGAKADQQYV